MKAHLLMNSESQDTLFEDIGSQVSPIFGVVLSAKEGKQTTRGKRGIFFSRGGTSFSMF